MHRAAVLDHNVNVVERRKLLIRLKFQGIVRRLRRPLIVRSVAICLFSGALVAILCMLRPPWPSVGADIAVEQDDRGRDSDRDRERSDLLDDQERRLAESIVRARESAVTLEYAPVDGPPKARRVATGVVINDAGDVLSIRIDPPPATAPVIARDALGHRHPAQWLACDAETGLTLLRIKPGAARPIGANLREPRLGSQVLVIGNPFGLGHSVLRGHISGLDRRLELEPKPLGGLIQIAVALHPGDSGALVTNVRGEWLGLIRSGLALPAPRRTRDHEHDHDLGFAIPARDALWVADQLRSHGRVDRAYLGVRIDPGATTERPGAVLLGVLDDSPAGQAGLQAGDRIITLNGHTIESPGDLTDRLDRTLAGTEITLDILRGTHTEHHIVRTVNRPPPATKPAATPDPATSSDLKAPPTVPSSDKADDLRLTLPREVIERLERLERRVEELEKRARSMP
jgi:S1-C subfamily serine protease